MKNRHEEIHCDTCGSRHKSVFCSLSASETVDVDSSKTCNTYSRGEVIFHEGNRINGIYCVSKGKIKLFQIGNEGKEQIIRFAKDGDIIGYRSLLSEEPLSASAAAIEDSSVCFIPKSQLLKLIANNPNFNFKMLKLLSHELGEAARIITELAQKPVRERLAETLLILKDTFDIDDNQVIQVKLSREEIANIVGTATESVIRLLSDFKKENLIEVEGRNIRIVNISALTRVANVFE
ncbi:Crp/Fnr family transcriptional regulator [Vicingus serpentipes]|jgi:CRP/FNR family transcriptional regulator, polysaccharide utilization system transcription regulator|uniref:Crp/Fnr family transcriptional regulator n=1 Tax=Vicingus serpentipes TaxID=1926625 RepID=A0A5C6S061_9FLAO|nr:Crp/Fnr family transcriptional regulator [Vicingus serpentipes]TXB67002.1 Crp/Fnr family transcriptional regulator [Vicingus serpentipes]